MAAPVVFVSSTFYDLRYMRESVQHFIERLGYTPVLSEAGTVFYDPTTTAAESCTREVSNADVLVLLIGGRYGSEMPGGSSVTNAEYQRARQDRIPVFAMVEQGTYNDYQVYKRNAQNEAVLAQINFPSADDPRIFEFIKDVESSAENNALMPFQRLSDVESYLQQQWAGMMHRFLSSSAREARVEDTLEALKQINTRVEMIAAQILRSVGKPADRVYIRMLQDPAFVKAQDRLKSYQTPLTSIDVLSCDGVDEWLTSHGVTFELLEELPNMKESPPAGYGKGHGYFDGQGSRQVWEKIGAPGILVMITRGVYDADNAVYQSAREALTQLLNSSGLTLDQLVQYRDSLAE